MIGRVAKQGLSALVLAGVLCLGCTDGGATAPPGPSAATGPAQQTECALAAPFVMDSFAGPSGAPVTAHTGERGAAWSDWTQAAGRTQLAPGMRVRASVAGPHAVVTASGTPPGPDYEVSADFHVVSLAETTLIGVLARRDDNTDSEYMGWYNSASATWGIARRLGGTGITVGGTYAQTLAAGGTYRVALRVRGSRLSLLVDGAERVSGTDTSIEAPGRAGIRMAQAGRAGDDVGLQLGNFRAAGCAP
ncbi:MAG: hypothetical protein ABR525_05220 [Candidatus Limnocylindria bacterium]